MLLVEMPKPSLKWEIEHRGNAALRAVHYGAQVRRDDAV